MEFDNRQRAQILLSPMPAATNGDHEKLERAIATGNPHIITDVITLIAELRGGVRRVATFNVVGMAVSAEQLQQQTRQHIGALLGDMTDRMLEQLKATPEGLGREVLIELRTPVDYSVGEPL